MEQRSLRLGDIVDDYCPRERRLTNHAIVAIVEDAIRQTRCTTCDYEHVYKQGHEPRRRKPPSARSLFEQVMTDVDGPQRAAARIVAAETPPGATEVTVAAVEAVPVDTAMSTPPPTTEDVWPGQRTLIRATLPKTDGEPPPTRPIPEFTMHQKSPSSRARQVRVMFGPQGDPFGRPLRGGQPPTGGRPNGNPSGNAAGGDGPQPGKRRGRRRGKRSH